MAKRSENEETILRASGVCNVRGDQILADLREQNRTISESDLTEKYRRMAATPLSFYRGANHLFWRDFACSDRMQQVSQQMPHTWIQGDLHVYNFGSYDNSREETVYGLNDFDEAIVADPQYDVWRLAVSIVLAIRQNNELSLVQQKQVIDAYAQAYVVTMRRLSKKKARKKSKKMAFNAKHTLGDLSSFLNSVSSHYTRKGMLKNWTKETSDGRRFKAKNGKLMEVGDEDEMIRDAMSAYRRTLESQLAKDDEYFEILDVKRRLLAGTGSLGTSRFYVLIRGSGNNDNDLRILDVKRQSKPTPYLYLGESAQERYDSEFANDAQRHTEACHRLTSHTDPHVGWMMLDDGAYSVRDRSPFKESFPCEVLDVRTSFSVMAEQWAVNLAGVHAHGNKDLPEFVDDWGDEARQTFCHLVQKSALEYADQVLVDWRIFVDSLILPAGVEASLQLNPLSYKDVLPY